MEQVSLFASFLKMIAALAVVLGVMIVAAYLLRKVMGQPAATVDCGAAITIVSARRLGPKNSIVLVEVLGHILAVGVSQQHMTVLADISDHEAREKLKNTRPKEQAAATFASHLLQYKEVLQSVASSVKNKRQK